ncbi:MAG TPA: hypothetical protein VEJ18_00080 [Planctomycetota bacterium]|nr:hypothetical protein [Planctomycetota bacterium]
MRLVLTGMAVLAAGGLVGADEVILQNGQTLEGIVTEKEDRVVVDVGFGTVTLAKGQVKEIVRKSTALQDYEERLKSTKTAEDHYKLGQWAQEHGLKQHAEGQYRRAMAIDPGYAPARRQLGYVEHEGQWLTREQYMALKGFVEHEGRWIPWDLYEKLRKSDLEAQADRQRLHVLDSMLENRGADLPRADVEDRFDRVVAPRRAPWNWGVRRDR